MITLYDADRCPYCARVRIVLAEKGLGYETVAIDLSDRPAWLYEKNPLGKVPVLEEDTLCLPESTVIMEYLEERYPEPPLLPDDPAERALVRLQVERFDHNLGDAYYAFRRGEEGSAERLAHCLSLLERGVAAWAGRYSLAEIAYLPWLVRLRDLLGFDLSPYPVLAERLERLAERPAVAAEVDVVACLPR
ncbi:MAG TPA: glutathione S-transferase family protein [Gaiellaceae bacterium]|nr:glutathione S-transferase family protein [Gaiellaceae bacterium]